MQCGRDVFCVNENVAEGSDSTQDILQASKWTKSEMQWQFGFHHLVHIVCFFIFYSNFLPIMTNILKT